MAKPLVMVLAVAAVLVVPSVADAAGPCGCRAWAKRFIHSPRAQRTYTREWRRQLPRHERQRRVVKRRIYDWAKEGSFKESWCRRNPRLCKAAASCLIAAGYTFVTAEANGVSARNATVSAAGACATAATLVLIYG